MSSVRFAACFAFLFVFMVDRFSEKQKNMKPTATFMAKPEAQLGPPAL